MGLLTPVCLFSILFICGCGEVCPIVLGIAIAAFKIYRDNYQTRADLLVTSEGARQVELSATRGNGS
jgi:hypothetical protein